MSADEYAALFNLLTKYLGHVRHLGTPSAEKLAQLTELRDTVREAFEVAAQAQADAEGVLPEAALTTLIRGNA